MNSVFLVFEMSWFEDDRGSKHFHESLIGVMLSLWSAKRRCNLQYQEPDRWKIDWKEGESEEFNQYGPDSISIKYENIWFGHKVSADSLLSDNFLIMEVKPETE